MGLQVFLPAKSTNTLDHLAKITDKQSTKAHSSSFFFWKSVSFFWGSLMHNKARLIVKRVHQDALFKRFNRQHKHSLRSPITSFRETEVDILSRCYLNMTFRNFFLTFKNIKTEQQHIQYLPVGGISDSVWCRDAILLHFHQLGSLYPVLHQ